MNCWVGSKPNRQFISKRLLQIGNTSFNEPRVAEVQMTACMSIEFELSILFHLLKIFIYTVTSQEQET